MRRLLLFLTAPLALAAVLTVSLATVFAAPAQAAWLWPVHGEVITQYRNGSDPYAAGQHRGIDIAAAVGTQVVAAVAGEVRFAGTAGSSGLTVSVRTGDGYDTSYLHLSSISVRAGAHVSGGERLGAVGTTGERSAAAPHLHFGVREAGSRYAYLDPRSFLPPPPAAPPAGEPHPAPAPAPAPLVPGPAPAPAPRGAPAPSGAPRPIPAPGRAPRPAPGRAPRPRSDPGGAPQPAPTPHGAPLPAPAPGHAPGRVPDQGDAPTLERVHRPTLVLGDGPQGQRTHSPAPGRSSALGRASGPISPRTRSGDAALSASSPALGAARPSTSSSPDFGWALACAGLLLAAGILGLIADGRKATRRSRSRLAGMLRPLVARRRAPG